MPEVRVRGPPFLIRHSVPHYQLIELFPNEASEDVDAMMDELKRLKEEYERLTALANANSVDAQIEEMQAGTFS